ncbi:hypothetical protein [Undibacterium sp. TJN19]|uniref:hypothetical protein n=1 Tax=Undibacterium sp. TJN19 TaxID=3413055 RepID=UPI003BF20685
MHTQNIQVVGNALFDAMNSQCIGIVYGWAADPIYDEDQKITNLEALQPSERAKANALLFAAAPALLEFYRAAIAFSDTVGHEDATAENEHDAEARYDAAMKAVKAALE